MLIPDNAKALEVVRALSEEYSKRIILSTIAKSMSVEQISREQNIPISTCYRRVRELESAGVVKADNITIKDGKKLVSYKTTFKSASISLESGELRVDVTPNRVGSIDRANEHWPHAFSTSSEEIGRSGSTPFPVTSVVYVRENRNKR